MLRTEQGMSIWEKLINHTRLFWGASNSQVRQLLSEEESMVIIIFSDLFFRGGLNSSQTRTQSLYGAEHDPGTEFGGTIRINGVSSDTRRHLQGFSKGLQFGTMIM